MLAMKETENSKETTSKIFFCLKFAYYKSTWPPYKQMFRSTTSFEYHAGKLLSSRTFGNNNKQVLE